MNRRPEYTPQADPPRCFPGGTRSNHVLSILLSHVWEVVTEPSTEAFLPTIIVVHASGAAGITAASRRAAATAVIILPFTGYLQGDMDI